MVCYQACALSWAARGLVDCWRSFIIARPPEGGSVTKRYLCLDLYNNAIQPDFMSKFCFNFMNFVDFAIVATCCFVLLLIALIVASAVGHPPTLFCSIRCSSAPAICYFAFIPPGGRRVSGKMTPVVQL